MPIPKDVFEQSLLKFFEPIKPFLDDASVSEVMINGPDTIYIERKGKLTLTPAKFASRDALVSALRNLAQFVGKHVDEHHPILEGRLPDGSRVEAVLPPTVTSPMSARPWNEEVFAPLPVRIVPPLRFTGPSLFHQPAPLPFKPLWNIPP